jgi:methyl-accepting chemotaxis protein
VRNQSVTQPIWLKITACGFLAVTFTSLAIGGLSLHRQRSAGDAQQRSELARDIAFIKADIRSQERGASALALGLASNPEFVALVQRRDRDELLRRYVKHLDEFASNSDLNMITVTDASTKAIARVHQPTVFGDDMSARRKTIGETLKSGKLTRGIEPGREFLSVFASAPVMDNGKAVGVVDVGTSLTNAYFSRLKSSLDADIAIHLPRDGKIDLQNSTFEGGTLLSAVEVESVTKGEKVERVVAKGARTFMVGAVPLVDYSGRLIAVMEVSSDVSAIATAISEALVSALLVSLGICAAVLASFFVFSKRLAGSIARLTERMSQLASGDLSIEVPGQNGRDEVGAMARAVQVFKEQGVRARELEGETGQMRNAAEVERARVEGERAASAKELAEVVAHLGTNLARLAEGDLTARLSNMPPQYAQLQQDFNNALAKLERSVRSVLASAEAIGSGSSEVAQGSDDLSQRTEQQAASLEETAAALEQITATVRTTAEGARQSQAVVMRARAGAEQSVRVVGHAVGAMDEIRKSAAEIGNIIIVIDEIAFQTNLLALNAGVEAARAGDAGRGFAVVASEVRALAQRSAEAAKEIKELISKSSSQVADGVELVDRTGRALTEIASQVSDISNIVSEIASSAQEQATGLTQVNTAVNQMDQITQQNAAMVEQSTAASHALRREAHKLVDVVRVFTLSEAGRPVGSAGPASIGRGSSADENAARPQSGNPVRKLQAAASKWASAR